MLHLLKKTMKRKAVEGPIRNKEKSKQKLLNAVGKILRTKGFSALKVNDIAATAGLDKKLIYNYFGSAEKLIDAYIHSQDFWANAINEEAPVAIDDGGQALSKSMLLSQFDYIFKNKELQKILVWELSESRKSLKKLYDEREAKGEILFSHIIDPYFGEYAVRYRAILALLVSGIYYLDIHSSVNFSTMCGLDIKSEAGRTEIREAVSFIIDKAYADFTPKG
jgi:AcrR family transcriptional regulator